MREPRGQNRAERRRARHRGRSLRQRQGALAALTASALLLPGVAKAQEERWSMDYAFSLYSEDPIDSSKLNVGSADRYEIDTHQLSLSGPLTRRLDFGIDLVNETMTGASPWYIEPNVDGDLVVAMTRRQHRRPAHGREQPRHVLLRYVPAQAQRRVLDRERLQRHQPRLRHRA